MDRKAAKDAKPPDGGPGAGDTQSRQKGRPQTTQARFPIGLWSVGLSLLLTRMPRSYVWKFPSLSRSSFSFRWGVETPSCGLGQRRKLRSNQRLWENGSSFWMSGERQPPHLSGLPAQKDTSPRHPWEPRACKQALNCSFAVGRNAKCRKSSKPKTGSQYARSRLLLQN